ncbi:MAG: B12-binding domain-containing protein [Planctomycetaceae bacterium]|nr:B12-binding domain-containing protein [Planctomycetaceae bacterium]
MDAAGELVSPKQVARAIGVSESSLKRWCDTGRIPTTRTAGGHRRMRIADVIRFVREEQQPLTTPEVLGLPPVTDGAQLGLRRGGERLADALLAGQAESVRRLLFDLYFAGHSLSLLCDQVIAAALHEVGRRWECRTAEVYQERRSCEIVQQALSEFRRLLPPTDSQWTALGATLSDDQYTLPGMMADLVLRDCGWSATNLGPSIPADSLASAVATQRPRLFWLSVSYFTDEADFVAQFTVVAEACRNAGSLLVIGGQMLNEPLRRRLQFGSHCDSMQQLESLARSLRKRWPRRRNSRGVSRTR